MNKEEITLLSNFTKQKCKDNCEESGNCHDCWIDYETVQAVENLMKEYLKAQSQLDQANKKIDEIEEYIKEKACYDEKTKECKCSFSSMALDKVLSIIGGE